MFAVFAQERDIWDFHKYFVDLMTYLFTGDACLFDGQHIQDGSQHIQHNDHHDSNNLIEDILNLWLLRCHLNAHCKIR